MNIFDVLDKVNDWQVVWVAVGLMLALFVLDWVIEYFKDRYCQCDEPLIVEHLDGFKTCDKCRKDIKERRKK